MLVEADGSIVGRVDLIEVANGSASLGYRIASAAGRAWPLRRYASCARAAGQYGLTELRAAARSKRRVEDGAYPQQFVPVGETELNGRPLSPTT